MSPDYNNSDNDSRFDPMYTQNPAQTTVPNIVGWMNYQCVILNNPQAYVLNIVGIAKNYIKYITFTGFLSVAK